MNYLQTTSQNDGVHARQIAFFSAFLLPTYKLLEAPSLLARYAKGDLLLPALFHFLLQTGLLLLLLYASSRSEKTLLSRMEERLGKWSVAVYIVYALFFLFYAVLPLLDLEKFVYLLRHVAHALFVRVLFYPVRIRVHERYQMYGQNRRFIPVFVPVALSIAPFNVPCRGGREQFIALF